MSSLMLSTLSELTVTKTSLEPCPKGIHRGVFAKVCIEKGQHLLSFLFSFKKREVRDDECFTSKKWHLMRHYALPWVGKGDTWLVPFFTMYDHKIQKAYEHHPFKHPLEHPIKHPLEHPLEHPYDPP